jgi:hypothetical protein
LISAPSIASLSVPGTFNEDISADTIGKITVGTLSGSAIRATTSIASVIAGSTQNSEIFSGVQPTLTTLPATAADFANRASILKMVTVKGSFSNTQVAGWTVGTITLNGVQTSNGGTPFGVTANSIKRLRSTAAGAKPIVLTNVFAPFPATSLGGDATVRITG